MDTFLVEAVALGDLEKIVIGHNGQGLGAGWFLDKVVVTEMHGHNADKVFTFPCNKWLDDHEGDKKTERELHLLGMKT